MPGKHCAKISISTLMIMPTTVDTSQFVYKDMFGRDIHVGDYIVYAGLADRSGVLRAGRVIELTHSKTGYDVIPKVKCESWNNYNAMDWLHGERVTQVPMAKSGKQKAVSLGYLDRMIVVPEEIVHEKIKADLAGEIPASRW